MTKESIKKKLDKLGIDYPSNAKVSELLALLPEKDLEETIEEEQPVAPVSEEVIEKARVQARQDVEKEIKQREKVEIGELDKRIKAIQKKKMDISEEEKVVLNDLLKQRALYNARQPRDLDKLFPSQMSLGEMTNYCDIKFAEAKVSQDEAEKKRAEVLKYEEGDSTIKLRLRIKAYRNPTIRERFEQMEAQSLVGRTVRSTSEIIKDR